MGLPNKGYHPEDKMLAQFSGKIYPDLSLSVGRIPNAKKLEKDKEYDRDWNDQHDSYEYLLQRGKFAIRKEQRFFDKCRDLTKFNSSPKLSRDSPRYGGKGITGFGKKMIRSGACLLERKYGIKRLGLITCTLPGFTKENLKIISQNWGEVTRKFFQNIKRFQQKMGLSTELVSCTEIQPKRFRKRGELAPHVHFVYVCKQRTSDKKFSILACLFRRYWEQAVTQVVNRYGEKDKNDINFNSSVNCQTIKKSASAYIGKYMSKGGEIMDRLHEKGMTDYLPKQWWTATKEMKLWIKNETIVLDSATCSWFFYNAGDALEEEILSWFNYTEAEINGELRIVGCVGKITEKYYQLLSE